MCKQPVKSHWKQHNRLGSCILSGLKSAKGKIFGKGNMPLDLPRTSYSTVPSMDVEVGDKATSIKSANLDKIAKGIATGVGKYFNK